MSPPLKEFLLRWLITTVAVMVAANVIPGIEYHGLASLLVASLLLGIFNAVLRPLLQLLSLPLLLLTLGLFNLVINALLLYFVGQLVKSFHVDTFWAAFFGALVIDLVTRLLHKLTRGGQRRSDISGPRQPRGHDDPGDGPVIDV